MCTETWFRILTKKVLKTAKSKAHDGRQVPEETEKEAPDGKDYLWYEMGFFTDWSDENHCRVLCIGTPPELRLGLRDVLAPPPALQVAPLELQLKDRFALVRPLLDEVVKLYDDHTWRVAKMVRGVEEVRHTGRT